MLTYDSTGNIKAVTQNGNEYLTYLYDKADRLIRESNTELGYSYAYTYDGNNNIASVTKIFTQASTETTMNYIYEGDKLVGTQGTGIRPIISNYMSDANGNLSYRVDLKGRPHFIKSEGRYCLPHIHRFKWRLIDNNWRYIEEVFPYYL